MCRAPLACAPGAGEANAADAALMEEREDRPSRMGRYQTRPTMTPTRRCGGAASWPRGGEARGRRAAPAAAGSARVWAGRGEEGAPPRNEIFFILLRFFRRQLRPGSGGDHSL